MPETPRPLTAAERPADEQGRQYHIDLARGDLAEYILLPGDPERIEIVAPLLDRVELRRSHREFATVTGEYRGLRVSAVSTGIGTDNVEIVIAEALAISDRPTFVRVGSCGVLQPGIGIGDLVVTTAALRLDGTTSFYAHEAYPAVADYSAVAALLEASERLGRRAHPGITATAPGFFAPQGRPVPRLPATQPDIAEELAGQGVVNFEMEASAVLLLAGLAGCRAGVVCTVFAQRVTGEFISAEARAQAELDCVKVGLEGLLILSQMDEAVRRAGEPAWRPGLWGPQGT